MFFGQTARRAAGVHLAVAADFGFCSIGTRCGVAHTCCLSPHFCFFLVVSKRIKQKIDQLSTEIWKVNCRRKWRDPNGGLLKDTWREGW